MKQIIYIGLTLLVDVQDFAIWPFEVTVYVWVGVKQETQWEKPGEVHLDEEAGSQGLRGSLKGVMLLNLLINDQGNLTKCMLTRLAGDPCAGGSLAQVDRLELCRVGDP